MYVIDMGMIQKWTSWCLCSSSVKRSEDEPRRGQSFSASSASEE